MAKKSPYYIIVISLIIIWIFSLISSYLYPETFEYVVQEDGIIENLTAVVIFIAMCITGTRIFRLWKSKVWQWKVVMFGLLSLLIFALGEEISWGQRIFNIDSDPFFKENNTQGEMNIHNLKLGGIKLNFLISQVFTVLLSLYLLVLPYFYRKKENIARLVDLSGIPIPTFRQTFFMLFPLILVLIMTHGSKWEILEISLAMAGLLIILLPLNKEKIYN